MIILPSSPLGCPGRRPGLTDRRYVFASIDRENGRRRSVRGRFERQVFFASGLNDKDNGPRGQGTRQPFAREDISCLCSIRFLPGIRNRKKNFGGLAKDTAKLFPQPRPRKHNPPLQHAYHLPRAMHSPGDVGLRLTQHQPIHF